MILQDNLSNTWPHSSEIQRHRTLCFNFQDELWTCCAFSLTYVIVPLTSLWNINPKPQSHHRLFLPVLCGTLHDSVDDSAARRHDTSAFVTVHSVHVDQTCAETCACSPWRYIDRHTLIHLDRLMYIYEKCYFTDIINMLCYVTQQMRWSTVATYWCS